MNIYLQQHGTFILLFYFDLLFVNCVRSNRNMELLAKLKITKIVLNSGKLVNENNSDVKLEVDPTETLIKDSYDYKIQSNRFAKVHVFLKWQQEVVNIFWNMLFCSDNQSIDTKENEIKQDAKRLIQYDITQSRLVVMTGLMKKEYFYLNVNH